MNFGEWIPVDKALPEMKETYRGGPKTASVLATNGRWVFEARYEETFVKRIPTWKSVQSGRSVKPTHWMPLPPLPGEPSLIEQIRAIVFEYGEPYEKNEATSHPWWAIVRRPRLNKNGEAVDSGHILEAGPYFSREAADHHLDDNKHNYGGKSFVYCFSGHKSSGYKRLRELLGRRDG